MSLLTEQCSETYGKKLIGMTNIEDALRRLDKLTQEEARMAIAENLRATHAVDERMRGVTEQVLAVDDRVASVDNKVAEVIDGV
jgi:pyruvate-formate lyase